VLEQVEQVVIGKREPLTLILLGILAGGHVLIEDLPGLGKTLIARTLARALGLEFTRIQFTPDLLPSDVTGAPFFDQRSGELVFRPGPVFTQLLLADEINRTPPKTQAALLEAMAEHQVTMDGVTHPLPEPFIVLATDNPIEHEGTYPLPEAQLDRFVLRTRIGYPAARDERAVMRLHARLGAYPPTPNSVSTAAELLAMRASLDAVEADDDVVDYIVRLVAATREHPKVTVGASPRGSLGVLRLARAHAALAGRDFLIAEDVKAVAVAALGHRLLLEPELWVRRITGDQIVAELLDAVPTPPVLGSEATS
jgi:MoxR-like ATPase